MNTFSVFNIGTLVNDCDIPKFHSEVVSGDLIHLDPSLFNIIGAENDEDSIAPLLPALKKTVNGEFRMPDNGRTGR